MTRTLTQSLVNAERIRGELPILIQPENTAFDMVNLANRIYELEAEKRQILDDAWERVSRGGIETPIFKNIKMFDHPRYSWGELERLIKGVV